MAQPLAGQVCLVTGATRGIGKGIALQLGEAGATVYITGRTLKPKPGSVGGSLEETAKEIEKRGGRCLPVQCDHGDMDAVEKLFETISKEQDGRLDLLVNNAYAAVNTILDGTGTKFWDQPPTMWDEVNNVGLRNHYFCSVYAARMMVPRRKGLIVNVSSAGGLRYLFNVPYGVGKEACDRMAADCGMELRKENVAFISLWPGAVKTEIIQSKVLSKENPDANDSSKAAQAAIQTKKMFEQGESIEFAGKCIVAIASDPNLMKKTGRILTSGDLADEYNLVDIDGTVPACMRSLSYMLGFAGLSALGAFFPRWIKVPHWVVALGGNKF